MPDTDTNKSKRWIVEERRTVIVESEFDFTEPTAMRCVFDNQKDAPVYVVHENVEREARPFTGNPD